MFRIIHVPSALEVSYLGRLHIVFSRKGATRKTLGSVTDDSEPSAAGLSQVYEKQWGLERRVKGAKPLTRK